MYLSIFDKHFCNATLKFVHAEGSVSHPLYCIERYIALKINAKNSMCTFRILQNDGYKSLLNTKHFIQ